jgi:hypothetical protein
MERREARKAYNGSAGLQPAEMGRQAGWKPALPCLQRSKRVFGPGICDSIGLWRHSGQAYAKSGVRCSSGNLPRLLEGVKESKQLVRHPTD